MITTTKIKRRTMQLLLAISITGFSFSSCVPAYRSNTVFMPAFEEKGDLVAEASLGSSDLSINAGYAITEELAIIAGYQNRTLDDRIYSPSSFAEVGMAWFSKRENNISSEIMGGFGYGQYDYYYKFKPFLVDNDHENSITYKYLRANLQYNLHFHVHPMTFSLGSRFSYAHIMDFDDLTIRSSNQSVVHHRTEKTINRIYFEPVATMAINVRQVSLFAQSGFLLLVHGETDLFYHESFVFNLGLRYRLNTAAKE